MIRLQRVTLPAGLIVVVRKGSDGGLQVFVSDELAAHRQRAAVRLALRSARRPDWRTALLPLPVGLLLGGFSRSIMPIAKAVRSHAIASSAGALVLAAGASALIVGLPQHHGPTVAGQRPGRGQVHAPPAGQTQVARKPSHGHNPVPPPSAKAMARRSAGTPPGPITATPAPSAAPSASPPAPAKPSKSAAPPPSAMPSPTQTAAPSPSPPPPQSGHGTCLVILGLWVCL